MSSGGKGDKTRLSNMKKKRNRKIKSPQWGKSGRTDDERQRNIYFSPNKFSIAFLLFRPPSLTIKEPHML